MDKQQQIKPEIRSEISKNIKTETKTVEKTVKNHSSTKNLEESSQKVAMSNIPVALKILGKRKQTPEENESHIQKKRALSVNDRLLKLIEEQFRKNGKDRQKEIRDDRGKTEKTSFQRNGDFENDEQSKVKLLKEKYDSTPSVLNPEANTSRVEVNRNENRFSSGAIDKGESQKRKTFSVNERLSKYRQELILKYHPNGIIKNILSTNQKKKFSVNDRLQKLRAELQAKQLTVNNINVASCFSGRNATKPSLSSSKNEAKKIQSSKNENPKIAIQSYKRHQDRKFSVNDRLKKIQEELKSKKVSATENNSKTTENKKVQSESESIEMMEIDGDTVNKATGNKIEQIRRQPYENNQQTLSEHYDVVDRNLLKLFAETRKSIEIYDDTKYYCVIDTNVFLKDLHFINELIKLNNCDTTKIILIVPYVVLQELDSLKIRLSQAVSTLAVRAIKYLNEKFETKTSTIRGQSAIEAEDHLITINSADDSIINCCLQIKAKTRHVALLTHDINLKNKALSSNIKCLTKEAFDNLRVI